MSYDKIKGGGDYFQGYGVHLRGIMCFAVSPTNLTLDTFLMSDGRLGLIFVNGTFNFLLYQPVMLLDSVKRVISEHDLSQQ